MTSAVQSKWGDCIHVLVIVASVLFVNRSSCFIALVLFSILESRLCSLKKRFRALKDQIMMSIQVNNAALFVFKSVEARLLINIHMFAYDIQ